MRPQEQEQNQNPQPAPQVVQPTFSTDPAPVSPNPDTFNSPVQPQPMAEPTPQPFVAAAPVPEPNKKKRLLKMLTGALGAAVLLTGAAAAYYLAVHIPNKPENKLAAAFVHMVRQPHQTLTGTVDYTSKDSSSDFKGFTLDFESKTNLEASNSSLAGEFGVSGATFPFELRFVDKDLFMKVGGLGSLEALAPVLGGSETTAMYEQMFSEINDRWYVLDRSFMNEIGESFSCTADISFVLTDEDVEKIRTAYEKYPLFGVKSTSKQDIDGVATTKIELDPADNQTAVNFAKELETLSVVEKINACQGTEGEDIVTPGEIIDEETASTANFFAYVDSNKQLKRIEIEGEDESAKYRLKIDFSYQAVEVQKPEGAKPIQDLLGDLMGATALPTDTTDLRVLTN